MDRKSFLTALKRTLWWRLPPEELSAVLEDYNEYFDSGVAEGKSEQELCLQFGSPRDIVRELEGSMGKRHVKLPLIITLASVALVAFLYHGIRYSGYMVWLLIGTTYGNEIFAAVTAAAMLIAACYSCNCTVRQPSLAVNAVVYTTSLISFTIMLVTNWFMGLPLLETIDVFEKYFEPQQVGPFFAMVFDAQFVLAFLSCLLIVIFRNRLYRFVPAMLAVNAMTICTSFGMCAILQNMDDPNALFASAGYARNLGMLLLLLAVPILLIIGRKEKLWTAR